MKKKIEKWLETKKENTKEFFIGFVGLFPKALKEIKENPVGTTISALIGIITITLVFGNIALIDVGLKDCAVNEITPNTYIYQGVKPKATKNQPLVEILVENNGKMLKTPKYNYNYTTIKQYNYFRCTYKINKETPNNILYVYQHIPELSKALINNKRKI